MLENESRCVEYLHEGEFKKAFVCFQGIVAAEPYNIFCRNQMGFLLFMNGQIEEALSVLGESLSIEPDNVGTLETLVGLLKDQGRDDERLSYLERLLELEPSNPKWYSGICWHYYAARRPDVVRRFLRLAQE